MQLLNCAGRAGEAEATKEFGKGLLIGPFNVGWLGVERFYTKK